MSRIGKKPVRMPKGAKASVSGQTVRVEGPKGTLTLEARPEIGLSAEDDTVSVTVDESLAGEKAVRALWGTTRALINNMAIGVTQGYEKKLEISGVGWTGQVAGTKLKLKVGTANDVEVDIPTGVAVAVDKQLITVTGADKQAVGQFAAEVRAKRKPEPYNGKGIKYLGEVIRRKEGKKFGS
ncbi:MAG: 50S ribosomal protein L6 [Planctomycetota bacterium]